MKRTCAIILLFSLLLTVFSGAAFADGGYQVKVVDPRGEPVPDVMVQFCSETECVLEKTDAEGVAVFDMPAGEYTIHLLKVPDGYAEDDTEYPAPAAPETVTLTLKPEGGEDEAAIDEPALGLRYATPAALKDMKGRFSWSAYFLDNGLLDISVEYYAVSEADWDAYLAYYGEYINAFYSGAELPEAPEPSWMSGYESARLYELFAVKDESREKALLDQLEGFTVTKLDSDGDSRFYLAQYSAPGQLDTLRAYMGEFFDEYEALLNDPTDFLAGLTLTAPQWPAALTVGDKAVFTTADLDGNPVDSAELFAQAKVTMINCWATWCGPCRNELPALGKMAGEFEAQDCQIVGLCIDAYDDTVAAQAKALLTEAGADYLNLRGNDRIDAIFPLRAVPTSFFVDSEGRVLIDPIEGAYPDGYRAALRETLEMVG